MPTEAPETKGLQETLAAMMGRRLYANISEAELSCHPHWKNWKDAKGEEACHARLLIGAEVLLAKQEIAARERPVVIAEGMAHLSQSDEQLIEAVDEVLDELWDENNGFTSAQQALHDMLKLRGKKPVSA